MQFSKKALITSAILGATIAKADSETIDLVAKSSSSEVDGYYVSAFHEGAGINFAFLADNIHPENYTYDDSADTVALAGSSIIQTLGVQDDVLGWFTETSSASFGPDDKLTVNGTSTFYACHNTKDSYQYSSKYYAVVLSSDYDDCKEITIYKSGSASNSTSSSSSSSVAAASSSSATIALQEGGAMANAVSGGAFTAALGAVAMLLL